MASVPHRAQCYRQNLHRSGVDDSQNYSGYCGVPEYDVSLRKVHDGERKSEPYARKDTDPREYSCGDPEIEGKLAYIFLRNSKKGVHE